MTFLKFIQFASTARRLKHAMSQRNTAHEAATSRLSSRSQSRLRTSTPTNRGLQSARVSVHRSSHDTAQLRDAVEAAHARRQCPKGIGAHAPRGNSLRAAETDAVASLGRRVLVPERGP